MTAAHCLTCGTGSLLHRHHISGRLHPSGPYFDGALTVNLCQPCHTVEHVILRSVSAEWPGESSLEHRVRRVAMIVRRTADSGRPFVLSPVSAGGLASLLFDVAPVLGVVS